MVYHLVLFLLLSLSLLVNSFNPYMSEDVYISVFILAVIAIVRYGLDDERYQERRIKEIRKITNEAENIDKSKTLVFQGYFEKELGYKINLLPEYKDLVFKSELNARVVLSTKDMELVEKLKSIDSKVRVYFYKGIIVDVEIIEQNINEDETNSQRETSEK